MTTAANKKAKSASINVASVSAAIAPLQGVPVHRKTKTGRNGISHVAKIRDRLSEGRQRQESGIPEDQTLQTDARPESLSIARSSPPPSDLGHPSITCIGSFNVKRIDGVPPHNQHVFKLAKAIVSAEFLATNPWPEAAAIETLVRNAWSKARRHLEQQQLKQYGAGFSWDIREPDHEADGISKHIVLNRPIHKEPCIETDLVYTH